MGLETRDFLLDLRVKELTKTSKIPQKIALGIIKGLTSETKEMIIKNSKLFEDTKIEVPKVSKERQNYIYQQWVNYAKEKKISVDKALLEGLQRSQQIQDSISLYLAKKRGDIKGAYEITTNRIQEQIKIYESQLDVSGIEDFNKKYQEAIKNGALTPADLEKWDTLGQALLQLNTQRDTYIKNLKEEKKRLEDRIKAIKEGTVAISDISKEFQDLIKNTSSTLREKNSTRKPANQIGFESVGTQKDYKSLQEAFNSYANSVKDNSYMDIINLSIARNKTIEAGQNLDRQRELTAGEQQNDKNLKALEARLKNIEELLTEQNELQSKTEQNTYVNSLN